MSAKPEGWWKQDLGAWPGVAIVGTTFVLAVLSRVSSGGMLIVVAGVVLMAGAVIDLVRLVDARNSPWGTVDLIWLFAIVLLGFVGPIVWLASGRKHLADANAHDTEDPMST